MKSYLSLVRMLGVWSPASIISRRTNRKRQNYLSDEHIEKIIDTYQRRPASVEQYARRVEIDEIEANDFNLNISRYVGTAKQEVAVDLSATHKELVEIKQQIRESTARRNEFLKELGLSPLPASDQ